MLCGDLYFDCSIQVHLQPSYRSLEVPQVLVSQAKPGQSMSLEHAWRQRPVTQLPLAQSVPTAQVAQSAAVPVGATQRQVWAGSWQVPPGQSESTAQDPVQRPAVVSQVLLAQVVLALHAAHAGEPQEH